MGRHKELLNGGVMTGPDPAVLPPGVLSYIRNMVYKPDSNALQRGRGRIAAGTVTASAGDINGLRDMQFDNGDHYLIAQTSAALVANYSTAVVADTLTWGVLTTAVTAGTQLEAVHYNNRFYILNGVSAAEGAINTNGVIYLSATATGTPMTIRQHGMIAVSAIGPSATAASAFAASASGFYEYWTTEVYKYQQDGVQQEIEGTFTGTPLTVFVSSTSVAPVIQRPSLVNNVATHWRVYRSPVKTYSTDRAFPDGFLIAEQTTALVQITDSSSATVGSKTIAGGIGLINTFTNATRLTADDGNYASGSATAPGSGWNAGIQWARVYTTGYNFGGFQGPILGIDVELKMYVSSGSTGSIGLPFQVTLGKRAADGNFQPGLGGTRGALVTATAVGGAQTITLGGSADRWCPPDQVGFVDTDFDSNFMASIQHANAGATLGIDYIKVRPYYGAGASDAAIVPFPTVVYTFGDITSEVGKNGMPPSSNTGDIYQDCLVVNDVSAPKLVKYSFPGTPEYFPATYYLSFQTRDNDEVTCIRVVNNRLVVGLLHSVWRINYLPSERDASFDRGLAIEPISRSFGIVNPMCACIFSIDSDTELLAFVSEKGIHLTNAYHVSTQTQNQNWRGIISTASGTTSTPIALINDPENQELLFYYRNDDLTPETYMCLHLNYSLTHMGTLHADTGPSRTFEAGLKVSGPVHMRNFDSGTSSYAGLRSAWATPRLNGNTSVYLGYGAASGVSGAVAGAGKVYRETGANIPATDPAPHWITRRMYLATESGEARLNELYGYVGTNTTAGGAPALRYTALTTKTNDDAGEVTKSAVAVSLGGRKMHKVQFRNIAEGLRVSASVTANNQNDMAIEYMILDGENFGVEDSGL